LPRWIGAFQRVAVKAIFVCGQRSSVRASLAVSGMQNALRFFFVFFGRLSLSQT